MDTIYVHATNQTLEQTMNVIDPFARNYEQEYEQAGWESDFEMARR